jgi:hypothetical protein
MNKIYSTYFSKQDQTYGEVWREAGMEYWNITGGPQLGGQKTKPGLLKGDNLSR